MERFIKANDSPDSVIKQQIIYDIVESYDYMSEEVAD